MATSKLSKEARKPQNIEVSNVNSQDISNVNNLNIPKYKASDTSWNHLGNLFSFDSFNPFEKILV